MREKEERIRQMLGRLRDAKCQGALSELHDAHDSRLLMFPLSYTPAFRELDRCLDALRVAEPLLCRHVVSWYVDVEYRQRPVYTRKARGNGWELTVSGYPAGASWAPRRGLRAGRARRLAGAERSAPEELAAVSQG